MTIFAFVLGFCFACWLLYARRVLRRLGLSLFGTTSKPGDYILAAYHSPDSLTWSWCLSWSWCARDERRSLFEYHRWRSPLSQQSWTIALLWLGYLRFLSQDKMPIAAAQKELRW